MLPRFRTIKEREAKEQRTKRFFSILVISILALSVAAFAFMSYSPPSQPGEERYRNYAFTREMEGWETQVNGYFLLTNYLPQEVENINHSGTLLLEDFQDFIVYFVARTESERKAANELDRVLIAQKNTTCLPKHSKESACINMTPKDCSDARFIQKIIVFEEIEENEDEEIDETSIEYKDNCLTIKGNSINIIRAVDKVIFLLFEVIEQEQ